MTDLHVATINIRNVMDRWDERLPLLLADFAALQPDVCAMQEVVFPVQQDRVIASGGAASYAIHRGPAQRPEWGNSLLVRDDLDVDGVDRLDLGYGRAAIRAHLVLADGASILACSAHLHHQVLGAAVREEQAQALLTWLDAAPPTSGQIVMGDFNAPPSEPTYRRMIEAGLRSGFVEANGAEPDVAWPSGIVAPGMDTDGDPACLDYIWLRGDLAAVSARLVFDRPAVADPTLYPSDHFGLSAAVRLGE